MSYSDPPYYGLTSLVNLCESGIIVDEPERILRDLFRCRCKCVLDNLRASNGAGEVHTVGNLRNRAQLILDHLDQDAHLDFDMAGLVKRLEQDVVEFFQKKFSWKK